MHGAAPIPGTHVTIAFDDDGRFGGFAGCNGYGGGYTANQRGRFEAPTIEQQLMACTDPVGVMDQESAFVAALAQAVTYRIVDDLLEFQDNTGATTLSFVRQPTAPPMNPDELIGSTWRLVDFDGEPPAPGSSLTIAFRDGEASGSAGCRSYRATYQADDSEFHFVFVEMLQTEVNCPEVLALQEGRYTTALSWVQRFVLADGQLEFHTSRGEVLTFEPLTESDLP
ncbi:MAG: META domain-containing protein [Anaerolineales bacterium]|nr:META domain-containing protein [Anaerolineales bacterium]